MQFKFCEQLTHDRLLERTALLNTAVTRTGLNGILKSFGPAYPFHVTINTCGKQQEENY